MCVVKQLLRDVDSLDSNAYGSRLGWIADKSNRRPGYPHPDPDLRAEGDILEMLCEYVIDVCIPLVPGIKAYGLSQQATADPYSDA